MKHAAHLFLLALSLAITTHPSAAAPAPTPQRPQNVLKIIKDTNELSKFAEYIDSAGLEAMFTGKDITVFAPTNDAMGNIPSEVLKRAKADKEHLQSFIKYHTVTGSQVYSSTMKGRRAAPSSGNGETLSFDGTSAAPKVNTANFVKADMVAGNGVVHIMSAALIPPSLEDKPVEKKEPAMLRRELPGREKAPELGKPAEDGKGPEAPAAANQEEAPAAASQEAAPAAESVPTVKANPKAEKKSFWKKLLGK